MQCIPVGITIAVLSPVGLDIHVHRRALKNNVCGQLIKCKSRIEPAQGNQKLIRTDVPVLFVKLARLKLSPAEEQGMKVTVATIARKNPLMA